MRNAELRGFPALVARTNTEFHVPILIGYAAQRALASAIVLGFNCGRSKPFERPAATGKQCAATRSFEQRRSEEQQVVTNGYEWQNLLPAMQQSDLREEKQCIE